MRFSSTRLRQAVGTYFAPLQFIRRGNDVLMRLAWTLAMLWVWSACGIEVGRDPIMLVTSFKSMRGGLL